MYGGIIQPIKQVGNKKKGDRNHEEVRYHCQHDDGDVHVLHVHDFLRSFFR